MHPHNSRCHLRSQAMSFSTYLNFTYPTPLHMGWRYDPGLAILHALSTSSAIKFTAALPITRCSDGSLSYYSTPPISAQYINRHQYKLIYSEKSILLPLSLPGTWHTTAHRRIITSIDCGVTPSSNR